MSVWRVSEKQGKNNCKLEHEASCFTHIADASGMDVMVDGNGGYKIVVVGQGVELISLSLAEKLAPPSCGNHTLMDTTLN